MAWPLTPTPLLMAWPLAEKTQKAVTYSIMLMILKVIQKSNKMEHITSFYSL